MLPLSPTSVLTPVCAGSFAHSFLVGFYVFCRSEDFKVLLKPYTEWSSVVHSACCLRSVFLGGWEVGRIDLLEF